MPDSTRASDAEREAAVARLGEAAGEGRLTLEELGHRIERAERATTRGELETVTGDLPAPAHAAGPAAPVRTSWHVSPLGGLRRQGRFRLERRTVAVTVIGGARLDLREATLAGPEAELTKVSVIGGVRIAVPPGIRVEVSGFSVIGGRRVEVDERPGPGPVLRVRAFSLIGGVRVWSTR